MPDISAWSCRGPAVIHPMQLQFLQFCGAVVSVYSPKTCTVSVIFLAYEKWRTLRGAAADFGMHDDKCNTLSSSDYMECWTFIVFPGLQRKSSLMKGDMSQANALCGKSKQNNREMAFLDGKRARAAVENNLIVVYGFLEEGDQQTSEMYCWSCRYSGHVAHDSKLFILVRTTVCLHTWIHSLSTKTKAGLIIKDESLLLFLTAVMAGCCKGCENYMHNMGFSVQCNSITWIKKEICLQITDRKGYASPDHHWPTTKPVMLNDVAGGITFYTASPEPVTSVTCAQVKPALVCEKHKAPVADLPILVFCGKCQSSSTPLAKVRRTLRRINPRKSAGPDNIPGRVLRECADQISEVLADIFNVSLTQAAVPTCLKTATIIPVPKSSTVTGLNDYRPIALTPIVTKCFERLVMTHIKATIDVTVDPHQYAYRRNRSTDDAISSVVHTALTHLEQKDSYVRMLFVDFTSAFNTMIPQTLTDKLSSLGLRSSLCNWVLDFLTNRPQSVRIHNLTSSTTILSTGSPQGCVLSPLLFTLLTYDCSPIHSGCHIVKFADDTAVVGCITNSDESGYRQEVEHLEGWCRKNNLCINIKKTKEMIVDFRRGRHAHLPLHVGGSAVEVVSSYRYLGVHLSNNLTWSNNTSSLVRKAHQRLYFLRRLRRAGLGSSVLTSFYRCVVESVLCSSINVWHGSCSAADRKALQRVVKAAQRSVGVSLPTTTDIYTSRCRKRATCIMRDPTHPAHPLFVPLPSGRRLRSVKCRTNRLRNSFIPEAMYCMQACEHIQSV
ncbi:hypothetical protein NFI96_000602 [Prochilodus magdalenae]|nr:hypothetical protein NFI96_000602 [Prochilodus magdalenae]